MARASESCRREYSASEKRGYSGGTFLFLRELLRDAPPKLGLVQLADPRDREGLERLDALRKLELGQAFLLEEASQRLDVRRCLAGARHEVGAGSLDQQLIGHRYHGDVGHRRVAADQVLDLLGAVLLAAAV